MDPIIVFRSWEVVIVGTWIWLRRSTRFCRCLYEAMSNPHKDILACVFCSCLRTSSSLTRVCWVDLIKASMGLSVSKCRGLKCLPPFVNVWLFTWGLMCLLPFVDVWLFTWGLMCLPPFVDVWLLFWGLMCLPTFVDVWSFSDSSISFHMSYPVVVVEVLSINSSHVIMKHSGRS